MFLKRLLTTILIITAFTVIGKAQHGGGHGHGGHINPDSLETVTVSGFAIVDTTSMMHPMYYLDENNDGEAEYFLNFGPYWYEPDSSDAVRPEDGDEITITGGLFEDMPMMDESMLIVYEINGEFWRNPFDAFWNHMGEHHMGGEYGECHGYGFGWMHDSLETVTVNGTAMVDTTFMHEKYYLDENNDQVPDYFLNFGPPWYEPESGATRPEDGDDITVVGGLLDSTGMGMSMVIVYEINGMTWRDTSNFGNQMGSSWIHENMTNQVPINSPFDHEDMMVVNPGWHHGMMMPDSLYCQFLELFPEDLPQVDNENAFAGYEVAIFYPNGMGGMGHNGECGGHMQFDSDFEFTLHYNDVQAAGFNIDESTIQVKAWDSHNEVWTVVPNANLDTENNVVTFATSDVDKFLVLSADQATDVNNENETVVNNYSLKQNYPNPFNPNTTIQFTLPEKSNVKLTIYNVIGQKVKILINNELSSGLHTINFEAGNFPSGTYFYELTTDKANIVKKMILLK